MERFELPLLRINANYLHRKYRDFDLLSFFLELWFLRDSVFKALEAGFVPVPFDDPLFGGDFDPSVAMIRFAGSVAGPIGTVVRRSEFEIYSTKVRSPHPARTTGSAKTTLLAAVASCGSYFQAAVAASLKR